MYSNILPCVCVCMYVCMYVCIYACIQVHICARPNKYIFEFK